jgi:hypothetical protein
LEVMVTGPSVTHIVTPRKLEEWLNSVCRGPNEQIVKQRLKELLA